MYEILPGKSRDWYKIAASTDLQTITLIRIYICGCLKYINLVKLKITIFNEY